MIPCACPLKLGREGQHCEEDVDGCAQTTCFEGVECTDVPAPGIGAECGPCPDGYSGNGGKCAGMSKPL